MRVFVATPRYFAPITHFQAIVDSHYWAPLLSMSVDADSLITTAQVATPSLDKKVAVKVPYKDCATCPVRELDIDERLSWRATHLKQLARIYGNATHYNFMIQVVNDVLQQDFSSVGYLALNSMQSVLDYLIADGVWKGEADLEDFMTDQVSPSDLATRMVYLVHSAGGSELYLPQEMPIDFLPEFKRLETKVTKQEWEPKGYSIRSSYECQDLSILDLLAWTGRNFTKYFLPETD